jgi:hypothetical protein
VNGSVVIIHVVELGLRDSSSSPDDERTATFSTSPLANFDMCPEHPPLRQPPPPPARRAGRTTSWEQVIAKVAGVVPKVSGSVSFAGPPGKTGSFAPMPLHCSFETTWRNLCASKDTHALGPQILRFFLANFSHLSSFSSS